MKHQKTFEAASLLMIHKIRITTV